MQRTAERLLGALKGFEKWVAIASFGAVAVLLFSDVVGREIFGQGIFWAQYRVENVRILPVFGAGALQVSPRVGFCT